MNIINIKKIIIILCNTNLENFNFQYDNSIHRSILMTIIRNNTNNFNSNLFINI